MSKEKFKRILLLFIKLEMVIFVVYFLMFIALGEEDRFVIGNSRVKIISVQPACLGISKFNYNIFKVNNNCLKEAASQESNGEEEKLAQELSDKAYDLAYDQSSYVVDVFWLPQWPDIWSGFWTNFSKDWVINQKIVDQEVVITGKTQGNFIYLTVVVFFRLALIALIANFFAIIPLSFYWFFFAKRKK